MKWLDLRIQIDLKLIENFNYVRNLGMWMGSDKSSFLYGIND